MGVSVLVVDDAVLYSTMVRAWFAKDPHVDVVGTAADRDGALAEARRLRPDVVLLDHLLGDHVSADVVPLLRTELPEAAIVLVSGLPEGELRDVARDVRADGWVTKLTAAPQLRTRMLMAYEARTGRVAAPSSPGPGG